VIQNHHTVTQKKKDQRKERVLHTRVSEKLDTELKEKAAGLGVSVSNLVRNILLNTVEMVEDIVADSNSIARAASKNKAPAAAEEANAPASPNVLGWQPLTLNLNALCDACNAVLPKGADAAMAVCATPGAPIFRCQTCIPQVNPDEANEASGENNDESDGESGEEQA
jgi:predicted RNA-binding Zn-ribbon protein involved in translation (DUF1610 family)